MLWHCSTQRDGSGSGFGSRKTVATVPAPLSLPEETGQMVPVSGSGSVPEPPCKCNTKNLGRNPPSHTPGPQETPGPANSLCLGPLFPSKYRKKAYIKNFEGGGSCGPQNSLC